jgi:hypothetical protein
MLLPFRFDIKKPPVKPEAMAEFSFSQPLRFGYPGNGEPD